MSKRATDVATAAFWIWTMFGWIPFLTAVAISGDKEVGWLLAWIGPFVVGVTVFLLVGLLLPLLMPREEREDSFAYRYFWGD